MKFIKSYKYYNLKYIISIFITIGEILGMLIVFEKTFDRVVNYIIPMVIFLLAILGTFAISNWVWKTYHSGDPEKILKSSPKTQKIADKVLKIGASLILCVSLFSIMLVFDVMYIPVAVMLGVYFIISAGFVIVP